MFLEENGTVLFEMLYHPSKMAYHYSETRDRIGRQSFYNAIARMKKEGFIEEQYRKKQKRFLITEKGRLKILGLNQKVKDWDGKWRIVIFDIPEEKHDLRDFFRAKLQDMGYRFLQESVWICPYNIADKVEDLIELCHVGKYIHYLVVEELDNNNVLMKLFNLKGINKNKYNKIITAA